jgi:hypothetical protein
MLKYLKGQQDTLSKVLKHIETAAIVELLLKLLGCETLTENLGAIEVTASPYSF